MERQGLSDLGASSVIAQMNAISQPMRVQPANRFSQKMGEALRLFLLLAIIAGAKYAAMQIAILIKKIMLSMVTPLYLELQRGDH